MAAYSMFTGQPGAWGGGGFGGIGDLYPALGYGFATAIPFARSLYDLQNQVMTDPFRTEAQIAQLDAQRMQNESLGLQEAFNQRALRVAGNREGLTVDDLMGSNTPRYTPGSGIMSLYGMQQPGPLPGAQRLSMPPQALEFTPIAPRYELENNGPGTTTRLGDLT